MKGQGSIEYNATGLSSRTYIYSIVANSRILAQQKMITQK